MFLLDGEAPGIQAVEIGVSTEDDQLKWSTAPGTRIIGRSATCCAGRNQNSGAAPPRASRQRQVNGRIETKK
jgi:hypothetical protein